KSAPIGTPPPRHLSTCGLNRYARSERPLRVCPGTFGRGASLLYFRLGLAYIPPPQNKRKRPMAGHSQFKNIMHRKGRQDAMRSKLFGKLAREITVAAKMGLPDPDMNPRLRAAIMAARAQSMPKDNIERAVKKA